MNDKLIRFTISELKLRIKEVPCFYEWDDVVKDSYRQEAVIDYEGLNDHEKMFVYILSWNLNEFCTNRMSVMRNFGWNSYKVGKMYRELKAYGLDSVAVFNERTGLIAGRGYQVSYPINSPHYAEENI